MLGLHTQLEMDGDKILPAERYGIQAVSLGFLTQDDAPVIWRGPMLHGAIQQFFRDVRWKDVDYLIVDMPPGTGDVALSLSQTVPVAGAVLVTTPQAVSLADTRRAIQMYRKLNIPAIGLIENMSYFVCPSCGSESDIFGKGGGERLAAEMSVPFLGSIPLQEHVRAGGDTGIPIVESAPDSPPAVAIIAAADRVAQQVSISAHTRRAIPLTQVN
jgi:ATP-binding protein involved in chromosome partitioning